MDILLILVVILVVVLMARGPKMLPRLGEAFGRGVKDARDEFGDRTEDGSGPPPPAS